MSDSVRSHRRQPTRLPRPWDSPGKNTGVGCHCLLQCMKVKSEREVAQSCPTLHDPMDRSLPGSSIHGIFQARVLEWGAIAFSEGWQKSSVNSQVENMCSSESHPFSVIQLCCCKVKQPRAICNKWVWLCSNKTLFTTADQRDGVGLQNVIC